MAGRAAAVAAAAAKERSSFAVTCGLLSQYLKEKKGGLQGLGLGLDMAPPAAAAIGGGAFRPPTTMNLLSGLDAPAEEPNTAKTSTVDVELSLEKASTVQLHRAQADKQEPENTREAAGEETRQLTIFYGGKVVVFDNFPSTKVKDLLQIVNVGDGVDKAGTSAAPQSLPRPAPSTLPDLPIARRNSLHRFLEKRKGRIVAKAPYQVNTSVAPSKQANGDNSWLGLGQEVAVKQEI
jgi:jasmonate ZIM domain-containing protein